MHQSDRKVTIRRRPPWPGPFGGEADLKGRPKVDLKVMPDNPIEILGGRERRRRWSVDQKLRIVAEAEEPGASIVAVAARHDVYPSLLHTWRRQFRRGHLVTQDAVRLESLDRETWFHPFLMDDALGPDERSGLSVVVRDEFVDVGDQLGHAAERSPFE